MCTFNIRPVSSRKAQLSVLSTIKKKTKRKTYIMDTVESLNISTVAIFKIAFGSSISSIRHSDAYLKPDRTSSMDVFCENSSRLKLVNYFLKKKKIPS